MADPNTINLAGNLPMEDQIAQQQINRQQQMAQLLMQQGQQQPQGQMISGHYVAPNFFQYATPLLNTYLGKRGMEQGDTEMAKLAQKIREGKESEKQAAIPLLKQSRFDELLALPNQYGGASPFQDVSIKRLAPELPTSAQELEYSKTHPELLPFITEKAKAGATKVVLPATESAYNKTFGEEIAKQDIALKGIADSAKTTVTNISNQKKILESGNFFSGKTANIQNDLANYGTALGVVGKTGQEKAANTQSLISGGAGVTLDNIKGSGLGAGQGFTDKDLQFLQDAKSYKITWNKENIARALDLQEKAAIEGAKKWNTRQGQIQKSATGPINVGPVDVPTPYSGQVKYLGNE